MTKQLLILAAGAAMAAAALIAQTAPHGAAFQNPGWMAAPGSRPLDVHMNRPEGEQSGPFVGKPFSATEVRHAQQTLADGTHVDNSDTTLVYRDVQGRLRVESPERIEIFDPVNGVEYDLGPKNKTYKKTQIHGTFSVAVVAGWSFTSSGYPAHVQGPKNGSIENLSPRLLNGINVKGARVTTTIPAGTFGNDRDIKVVNERWYSDDLQVLVKSSNSDPRFGVNTYELTNIVQGPPDPSLFQDPLDYKLMTEQWPTAPIRIHETHLCNVRDGVIAKRKAPSLWHA